MPRCKFDISDGFSTLNRITTRPIFLVFSLALFPDINKLIVAGRSNYRSEFRICPLDSLNRCLMTTTLRYFFNKLPFKNWLVLNSTIVAFTQNTVLSIRKCSSAWYDLLFLFPDPDCLINRASCNPSPIKIKGNIENIIIMMKWV